MGKALNIRGVSLGAHDAAELVRTYGAKNTLFPAHLLYKNDLLPRQARDKHRKS
jgi:hypothetical protein